MFYELLLEFLSKYLIAPNLQKDFLSLKPTTFDKRSVMKKIFCSLFFIVVCTLCSKLLMGKSADNNREIKIFNSIGMAFVYIPPGSFLRGSPITEPGRESDETQQRVTFTSGYYIQTTEVTQKQWKAVMEDLPLYIRNCNEECPVDQISWYDAKEFISKLNKIEGTHKYRLPTEAEWEYASRAGSKTSFANGKITVLDCDYDIKLGEIGWYCGNSRDYPLHPVAQKNSNAWGLYDMHGSVWEWCSDWYDHYPSMSVTNPIGPPDGIERVMRGGGIADSARSCRSANRHSLRPDIAFSNVGFRVIRSP